MQLKQWRPAQRIAVRAGPQDPGMERWQASQQPSRRNTPGEEHHDAPAVEEADAPLAADLDALVDGDGTAAAP
jgi:hypothetical protein